MTFTFVTAARDVQRDSNLETSIFGGVFSAAECSIMGLGPE
jgi:hypothetical protein